MTIIFVSLICSLLLFLYLLNERLMPTYLQYAEVQTDKIASYVINKAISARTTDVLDVNEIIVETHQSDNRVTTSYNTEIINRVRSEVVTLIKQYLEDAENGDLSYLPNLQNVEYDVGKMEAGEGIVFFVPLGQAANLPIIGNLGPKIPIRFHIIGSVHSNIESKISEFGINNALVEVLIQVEVNVEIIVPLASSTTHLEESIPVAIGIVSGTVPQIYTNGGDTQPSIEVPIQPRDK